MKHIFAVCLFILILSVNFYGSEPLVWSVNSRADVLRGDARGVSIDQDGTISLAPKLTERLVRYEINAALLIPASRLCHQTLGIIARRIEESGIPTILISVDKLIMEYVRAPRTAYYDGEIGSVVGPADWPEFQLRVLDETQRTMETFDQPGARKLAVHMESKVEAARGER